MKNLLRVSKKLFGANLFYQSTSKKVCYSPAEAVADIKDGQTLLIAGFSFAGAPQTLIRAVREKGVKDLTVASINAGK